MAVRFGRIPPETERVATGPLGGALVARVLADSLGAVGFVSGAGPVLLVPAFGIFNAVLDGLNGWFMPGRWIPDEIAGSFLG